MENISFFSVDIFIFIVVLLSFLVGWASGATKEILSVVAWGGGIYLSISIFPYAKEITRTYISHKLIADFVTACGLFIVFLTLLSVFSYFCSNLIKKSVLNTTDKALGGIFGIVRGVVILAILDVVVNQCMFNETPQCVENSKLRPMINGVSNFVILLLPEDVQDKVLSHMSQIKKQSLLDFVKEGVIEPISPNSIPNIFHEKTKSKVVAEGLNDTDSSSLQDDEFIEVDEDVSIGGTQSAEELATLKPKKMVIEKKENHISPRGRNDMDRLLDQYDDVDEN